MTISRRALNTPYDRESNFELLRIICMLFIIIGHIANSRYVESCYGTAMYYILNAIRSLVLVAVNVYILISGYFGIKFSFRKIGHLGLLVLFYSLIRFFLSIKGESFDIRHALNYILPVTSNVLWFVGSYFVLVFLSPFINKVISVIDAKQHRILIILGFFLFYLWPTVADVFNFNKVVSDAGYGPTNFIMLYLIGRYIRYYYMRSNVFSSYKWFGGYVLSAFLLFFFQSFYSIILGFSFTSLFAYDSVFILSGSICLFMAFNCLIINSRTINILASNCFSVYVIHSLFPIIPPIVEFIKSFKAIGLIPLIVAFPISIYLICICIEFLRKSLFRSIEESIISFIVSLYPFRQLESVLVSVESETHII